MEGSCHLLILLPAIHLSPLLVPDLLKLCTKMAASHTQPGIATHPPVHKLTYTHSRVLPTQYTLTPAHTYTALSPAHTYTVHSPAHTYTVLYTLSPYTNPHQYIPHLSFWRQPLYLCASLSVSSPPQVTLLEAHCLCVCVCVCVCVLCVCVVCVCACGVCVLCVLCVYVCMYVCACMCVYVYSLSHAAYKQCNFT